MNAITQYKQYNLIKRQMNHWGVVGTCLRAALVLVAIIVGAKLFQLLFWWIIFFGIGYFVHWIIMAADRKARAIDNPPPAIYDLQAEAVWYQIEHVLRTVPSFISDVSVHIDQSIHTPPPGQPLFVQAKFRIFHHELLDHKDIMPNGDKSLTSALIMQAWIEPLDVGSRLLVKWTAQLIYSRETHDQLISTISEAIDTQVRELTNQMQVKL